MACIHLRQLYELCQTNKLSFSSSDLVRIVCKECESAEVCPTSLVYESAEDEPEAVPSQKPPS